MADNKKFCRIKGVNSDYKLNEKNEIVKVDPLPLTFMEIYFCPHEMPGPLESLSNICKGTKDECSYTPGAGEVKSSHAKIRLAEDDGIKLVVDGNNHIQIAQDGIIHLNPGQAGKVVVRGNFITQTGSGNLVLVDVSEGNISFQNSIGSKLILKSDGNIELFTKDNSGTVTINGNVQITKDLKVDGTITPPPV